MKPLGTGEVGYNEHLDNLTLAQWLTESSLSKSSLANRKRVIALFEQSNGKNAEQLLDEIKEGKASPYLTSKICVDFMRPRYAPYTCYVLRSLLPVMFETVLGEARFSRRTFNRLVPAGDTYVTESKQTPEREKVVEMLKVAPPFPRALVGFLAITGMRIMEALTRKWTDLEIREQGYARVKLKAADTKARYARYSFITKETIELLNAYRVYGGLKSDYLFPTSANLHTDYNTAHEAIKPLFAKVGLYDAKDRSEVYTIHSFRTFASDRLRECGMTDKSAKAIIGHRDGSESSYIDWNNVEKEFREKCAERLCFSIR